MGSEGGKNIAVPSGLEDDNGSVISESMQSLLSSATANASTPMDARAFDKVIKFMLRHYPQGARTPQGKTGTLPLVLAAQVGHRAWNDGMETLLHAYPPALHSRKLKLPLNLYPHIFARINGRPECYRPTADVPVIDHSVSDLQSLSEDFDGGVQSPLLVQPPDSPAPSTRGNDNLSMNRWSYGYHTSPGTLEGKETPYSWKNAATTTRENDAKETGDATILSPTCTGAANGTDTVVRPRVATTIFELLRTKPDLISNATSSK